MHTDISGDSELSHNIVWMCVGYEAQQLGGGGGVNRLWHGGLIYE